VKTPTFLINFYSKQSIQKISIIKLPRINYKIINYIFTSVYAGFTKDSSSEKKIIKPPQRKKYLISSLGCIHPSTVGGYDIYDSYLLIFFFTFNFDDYIPTGDCLLA